MWADEEAGAEQEGEDERPLWEKKKSRHGEKSFECTLKRKLKKTKKKKQYSEQNQERKITGEE